MFCLGCMGKVPWGFSLPAFTHKGLPRQCLSAVWAMVVFKIMGIHVVPLGGRGGELSLLCVTIRLFIPSNPTGLCSIKL